MFTFVSAIHRSARRAGKPIVYFLAHPRSLFDRDKVVTSKDGIRFWSRRENLIERSIADTGYWEPAETEVVRRYVGHDHVCLDVGANIGYFSLLMAKLGANVFAFEPTEYGYDRMRCNLALNPEIAERVTSIRKGLSNKQGEVHAALEARFSGRVLAYERTERIQLETLDDWWPDDKPLHFVKIDVDGHDINVVRGGARVLRQHRPLIMAEFCERELRRYGGTLKELGESYIDCGYQNCIVIGTNQHITLRQVISAPQRVGPSRNLLLTP